MPEPRSLTGIRIHSIITKKNFKKCHTRTLGSFANVIWYEFLNTGNISFENSIPL
jgi:hypothetical protein